MREIVTIFPYVRRDSMKKKVLFVATVVKTHIMQFHIPYLKLFQEAGWETAVASRNDYENPSGCVIPYCDTYYDIPFERMPWKPKNLKAYKMLKEIIDREHYDIIHCHTPVGALIARLAALDARKKGTRVIYTAHGFHFFTGAPLQYWLLFYPPERLLAPVTDVLITINREDYARAQKRLPAKQIEYVPGVGIDTGKFRNLQTDRQAKRASMGFSDEDFLMLTVAEMTPNKNHITVLKALAALKDRPEFARMHYLIVGRGELWQSLEKSAAELGISDHVHFLGYRTDAPELYHCCDLFVFMTFREGLSVALMEAMSSAMPIVCTKIRGNTDLIEDGVSGLFCQNSPEALAQMLSKVYAAPEKRKALGQAAAERSLLFDEKTIHERMKEIYFGE